jgi:hypothetical protein
MRSRNHALDGLRGLAALGVLTLHVWMFTVQDAHDRRERLSGTGHDLWLVVEGTEDEVAERVGETCSSCERAERDLELAAGQLGLEGGRSREGSPPSVPVGPDEPVGDGAVVVELEALGLRERSLEAVCAWRRGRGRCGRRW